MPPESDRASKQELLPGDPGVTGRGIIGVLCFAVAGYWFHASDLSPEVTAAGFYSLIGIGLYLIISAGVARGRDLDRR